MNSSENPVFSRDIPMNYPNKSQCFMVKSPIKHDKHGEIPIELPSSVLGPPRPKEGPWFACAEDR